MSNENRNRLSTIWEEIRKGNLFIILITIIGSIWAYNNVIEPIWSKFDNVFGIATTATQATTEVAIDVYSLRQEVERLKSSLEQQRAGAELGKEIILEIR